jgi:hypothetical protein
MVTDARSLRRRVALLAQVREGSAADSLLKLLPVSVRRVENGHAIHAIPDERIGDAIETLKSRVPSATNANATTQSPNEVGRAAA